MAGLKILPIRKKSIEKMCTNAQCSSNKKQYIENTKKDMIYPQEDFLTTTTREEKK